MSSFTIIELMALVLSAMSSVAILYLAMQLAIMKRIYMQESRANQMERTLKASELPPSVTKIMGEVMHYHYRGDVQELYANPKLLSELYPALNTLENLSIGILSGIYNEEIAYSHLGSSLPIFYEVVQRFIYESRGEFSSASQYVNIEQLARRWSDKKRNRYKKEGL